MRHTVAVALIAGLLVAGTGCTSGKATPTTVSVRLAPSRNTYGPGDPVVISVILENRTGRSCKVVGIPEGTVKIVSLTLNGSPVTATRSTADYVDGFPTFLAANVTALPSGKTVTMTVRGRDPSTVDTAELDATGQAATDAWPVRQPGRYTLTATYLLPPLPGTVGDLCPVSTDPVSVSFTVSGG